MAFDLKGGLAAARRFCDRTRVFLLAASLGGAESLVLLPVYSSHYRMTVAELQRGGNRARNGAGFDRTGGSRTI